MSEAIEPHGLGISDRLLASSQMFARSAAGSYAAEAWEEFYLHLATAVEQLIKAVLADAHPTFIADPRADFDSLLHLSGLAQKAKKRDSMAAIRTISATVALDRVGRLVEDYRQPGGRVRLLLDMRNAVVHLGSEPRTEGEAVLGEVAQFVLPLTRTLGIDAQAYWGDAHEMVDEHARQLLDANAATYQRRVQAAKDRYRLRVSPMDEQGQRAFLAAVEVTAASPTFDFVPAECPACGNLGRLEGDGEPEWGPDWDYGDGQAYLSGRYVSEIAYAGAEFECRACSLFLDGELLVHAKLDFRILTDKDVDLGEATQYYERQTRDEDWADYYGS